MRIKFIIPFPLGSEAIARRAAQIPLSVLHPATSVECVPVRASSDSASSPYDMALFDMYIAEAGLRAEEEGFDAVVMDTVGDSGMTTLRSRLSIPVVGPGQASFAAASLLGRRFSIIGYVEEHRFLYEKALDAYHARESCASIRFAGFQPDFDGLIGDNPERLAALRDAARQAVEDDHADTLVLGSTTLHEAEGFLSEATGLPVVNPVPVAIKMAEMLVQLRLSHSKAAYPFPRTPQDDKWFALPDEMASVRL